MTVDQSAAFDCLNHQILIRKLRKYGLSVAATTWIQNYLSFRSQYVTIGASDSRMKSLDRGVPQGSVIRPLLYSIYVNDLTETVIRENCQDESHLKTERLFGEPCMKCGIIVMYADDATYWVANKDRQDNKVRIEETLKRIKIYLQENELHLNVGKTALLECMIPQKKGKTEGQPPQLMVTESTGQPKLICRQGTTQDIGNKSSKQHVLAFSPGNRWESLAPKGEKAVGSLKTLRSKITQKM